MKYHNYILYKPWQPRAIWNYAYHMFLYLMKILFNSIWDMWFYIIKIWIHVENDRLNSC
ncbi:hypothetical protein [Plasmodium yoelii yoelii]|uniref:Uncharacterized protein n=1 Tax=Plasmodium yoelii yoelii TaxID=73239 RepID=Q7RAK2_PLAYO|nr:hypothetical protein [Plasmodium yoelii yoelii]